MLLGQNYFNMIDPRNSASICREQAKDYLGCRMEKGLMAKEEWKKLGFKDSAEQKDLEKSETKLK